MEKMNNTTQKKELDHLDTICEDIEIAEDADAWKNKTCC